MRVEYPSHGDIFVTTRWTVVLAAADRSTPQAERALEEICRIYWFPLYAYIRRRGHSPEDAEDLTQEFFRQLLEHRWIENADREKGKLRDFLITALKHFMAKEWRKETAQKRGGGQSDLSINSSDVTSLLHHFRLFSAHTQRDKMPRPLPVFIAERIAKAALNRYR